MDNKITFNGKEYSIVDEMPLDVRVAYQAVTQTFADQDKNGVPDIFEGKGTTQIVNLGNVFTGQAVFSKIIFEGKEYSSPDELPPDARAKYDQAMSKVMQDQNQNGIPDAFEGSGNVVMQTSRQFTVGNNSSAPPSSSTLSVTSNATAMFLIGAFIVILLLVIAALMLFFFLRSSALRG